VFVATQHNHWPMELIAERTGEDLAAVLGVNTNTVPRALRLLRDE
jgi:DNA-binding transcriptional regulator YhcF (GntR family)